MAKEKKQYVDKEILFGLVKEFHSINPEGDPKKF